MATGLLYGWWTPLRVVMHGQAPEVELIRFRGEMGFGHLAGMTVIRVSSADFVCVRGARRAQALGSVEAARACFRRGAGVRKQPSTFSVVLRAARTDAPWSGGAPHHVVRRGLR